MRGTLVNQTTYFVPLHSGAGKAVRLTLSGWDLSNSKDLSVLVQVYIMYKSMKIIIMWHHDTGPWGSEVKENELHAHHVQKIFAKSLGVNITFVYV
jgi:hypothetical protein